MGRRWRPRTRRRSASNRPSNATAIRRRAQLTGQIAPSKRSTLFDPERERESGPGLETDRELDRSEESEHDRVQEEVLEQAQVNLDFDLEM